MRTDSLQRMLKDFPFLWALAKEWDSKQVEIKVYSDDHDVMLFKCGPFDMPKRERAWVHVVTKSGEKIIPVTDEKGPWPTAERVGWSKALWDAIPKGALADYFFCCRSTRRNDFRRVEIYRAPRVPGTRLHCFREYLIQHYPEYIHGEEISPIIP